MSTLKDIVREFAGRSTIKRPNIVAGSLDLQVVQVLSLLNEEIEEVTRDFILQGIQREATFVTTAAENQGPLDTLAGTPVRFVLNGIMWNRTTRLPIKGPLDPQIWQAMKASQLTGPIYEYRIRGNDLLFLPVPTAGDTVAFEYVPEYVISDGDTPATMKQYFTKDTDTCLLPDVILLAGLRWRWKAEKGLPGAAAAKARYDKIVGNFVLRDGTAQPVSLTGEGMHDFRPGILVPPGSWNIPP